MTYPEAIRYLESFINYERISAYPYKESLKLERIKNFLSCVGNPQDAFNCIHIAGSKGKGSTCAFVTYILREAGFKTGLYTSPHLWDFRERIRILSVGPKPKACNPGFEGMISKKELAGLVRRLKPVIEQFNRTSVYGPLSFFEVYTALAFVYFQEQAVNLAVLETGLGGRLDATNVVSPLVCAITPISYEHTQKLGRTLREIAGEKAGIIKGRRLTVVSAPQEEEVMEVLRKKCLKAGAKLSVVGEDIVYKKLKAQRFEVKGLHRDYPDLRVRLIGEHQIVNATVAVGVIEALENYGINIGIAALRKGLYHTLWPGRCEVMARNPWLVLDGAQNPASSRVLKAAIKSNFQYEKLILVFGISKDKDVKGVCRQLQDLADRVILTKANNPRAAEARDLRQYFRGKNPAVVNNVKKAIALSERIAKKEDLILVTGSLFVVGEARDAKQKFN